jgi:hypothetical protein
MQTKQFSSTATKFKALNELAIVIQTGTISETLATLRTIKASPLFNTKPGWIKAFNALETSINTGIAQFSVFALKGNEKLPFVAFSTLPGVTCPGAGACLDFCYSFRAWRYPSAFARMAQNTYFMRHNRNAISTAFSTVDASFSTSYDMRLYVDGDFSSASDVAFWFNEITNKPKAKVYGYSKSFNEILQNAHALPSNYVLNISGGHNAPSELVSKVKLLSITRGEFIAVSIGKKVKGSDHGTIETNKALRVAFGSKAFPCPGTCGTCTGKGHACGMQALKGIPIIITMH